VADQRVVIVTGSTSGIGRAIAQRCLASGWGTVVNSRSSREAGEELVAGLDNALYVQGAADATVWRRILDVNIVGTWQMTRCASGC
jgi:ketoreductase RED2